MVTIEIGLAIIKFKAGVAKSDKLLVRVFVLLLLLRRAESIFGLCTSGSGAKHVKITFLTYTILIIFPSTKK